MNKTLFYRFSVLLLCIGLTASAQIQVYNNTFTGTGGAAITSGTPAAAFTSVIPVIGGTTEGVQIGGGDAYWGVNFTNNQLCTWVDANLGIVAVNAAVYTRAPLSAYSAPFSTTLSLNPSVVTWTFNIRTKAAVSGFVTGDDEAAVILGCTNATLATAGNGYAVTYDPANPTAIELVRYTGGIQGTLTTLVDANGVLNLGDAKDYASVKVTYTVATNTWSLSVRDDGTTAFADPATGTLTTIGSVVDATYTAVALADFGFYCNYHLAALSVTAKFAYFDNYTVTVGNCSTSAINGVLATCSGQSTTLTDATTGGTWSSSNTSVATAASSGAVTGIGAGGTATITYTSSPGCYSTTTVTINPAPAAISGVFSECQGSSTTLTDATASGTWSSSTPAVGSVGSSSGTVYGAGSGTTTITYTSVTGCYSTATFTVVPNPGAILGAPAQVCQGSSIVLSDAVPGGAWSTVAGSGSVSVVGGAVTGLTTPALLAGTATVSYSFGAGACAVSTVITINPVAAISPAAPVVCSGLITSVSDAIAGTWSSSNISIATIGTGTGSILGVAAGTSTIAITYATGCSASVVLTVNQSPVAISGTTTLCYGNATTFTDGTSGGSWSSSNGTVATIGSSSGIATAVTTTGGVTTISYIIPVTGCNATTTLSVNPTPAPIQGNLTVCTGLTTTLTDATAGGSWISDDASGGPVGSASGIVSGILSGIANITYTLPTGCNVTAAVTINSSPAAIEGNFSMCLGFPTQLSDPSTGGTWSSTNTSTATVNVANGLVTPSASGTTVISYAFSTGCYAITSVTVNPVPLPISGSLNSCAGYFTSLSDASAGGSWSSGNTTVATVNASSGLVYAEVTGTATIEYAFNTTGCFTSVVFTVNPSPVAIDGTPDICQGLSATFNDPTPGGIWSSVNTNASVGSSSGIVTGDFAGPALIIYTLPTTCFVSYAVAITPPPTPINGSSAVCHNSTITLSDGVTPGIWNVTAGSGTASISASGVLTGGNSGVVTVSYTTLACNPVTYPVLVNPLPDPITGVGNLCLGSGTTLTDATPGGTWSSSNSGATVSSTGVVSGVDTGSGTTISYTLPTTCYVTAPVVVFPIPAPIMGLDSVCPGSFVILSDSTSGGAWSSSNGTIATAIAFTGRVEGEVPGNVTISYTLISGCYRTMALRVETPLPASLTFTQSLDSPTCAGQVDTFTAIAVNGGTPTFEWENWGSYIGTVNPFPFVPAHGDYITCVMTTHNICSSPAVVQTSMVLNVYPVVAPEVVITTSAASDTASFLGEVYTFYTDVTYGGVNPGYQWQINGISVSGATNSTFTTHIYQNNETIACIVTGTSPCDTPGNTNIGTATIEIYGVNYLSASSLSTSGDDLNLFPNPNSGNFTLSGTLSNTSGKDVTIEVTDMVGRTVYTGRVTPQNGKLNTNINLDNDLATGTYLLRVYTESGLQTFHFVIGK